VDRTPRARREQGRIVGIQVRVVFGDPIETLALFGQSTPYIERTHLTMRLFNGPLTRKTLAFSKDVEMWRASAAWEDLVYNLARSLKTLRLEIFGNRSGLSVPCWDTVPRDQMMRTRSSISWPNRPA
jgi:hypothetical protein